MTIVATETDFEVATLERLRRLGYDYAYGEDMERPSREVVVLKDRLKSFLRKRYPDVPDALIDEAVRWFSRPEGVDPLRRNLAFHESAVHGVILSHKGKSGKEVPHHLYPIDWERPENNDFLAVNQFTVEGRHTRRPDLVIFVNGLPLVVFELKNPYSDQPTVEEALNQLEHYKIDIPDLFEFNAVTVVSDGVTTLHGMWTSPSEWFKPWQSMDGITVEAATIGSMKTLIEGLFPKDRLYRHPDQFQRCRHGGGFW